MINLKLSNIYKKKILDLINEIDSEKINKFCQVIKKTSLKKKNIKKNIKTIFKNSNNAFLVYVNFPRKNARANTITLIAKDDFK